MHPTGVGTWELVLRRDPSVRVHSPGHTARDALLAARGLLGTDYFNDIEEPTLVSDEPIPEPFLMPSEAVA